MNHKDDGVQVSALILGDEARAVLEIIFNVVLNGFIGLLGSSVNVINIIIFFKQDFGDSVNISFCALAVSDLGSLVPLLGFSICSNPLFQNLDIGFNSVEIEYIISGLPHGYFVRITSCITAFITFERCVCITLPLKVKTIITPRRTLISIVAMFVVIFATYLPLFTKISLAPSFNSKINKTLFGIVHTDNPATFANFTFSFNAFAQISNFLIMISCTGILVLKLFTQSHWRHRTMLMPGVSDYMSTRDKRVMKMVTFISLIFIVCYSPGVVNLVLMVHLSPEYSSTGRYANLHMASWSIITVIDGINSSVTIFVYYNMSSKFRATFKQLFFKSKRLSVRI